ncbi:MAG: glycoside hydrolase family 38 C-terminal domain-containing protein [Anaerocolumna sp.]
MLNEKQIDKMLSKLRRFENTIAPMMFEKIDEVKVDMFPTAEQFHDIPEKHRFTPCIKGDKWGGEGTYCWFKGQYAVPGKYDGQTLFLYPKIEGYEALLWVNGIPFGTFCTKIVITGHGNHYCDMLKPQVKSGEVIDIALEYYSGHYVMGCEPFAQDPRTDYDFTYDSVDICLKNQTICDFYFDLRTLNQLVNVLDHNSFRRADIINTLQKVHELLYYSFEDIDKETFMEALNQAGKLLKEKLVQTNSATAPYAGFIGHSHMDTAWLWHKGETIKKCARTYSNQTNLMEQYPEYKFIQSSAYHSEVIRRHYPKLFDKLIQKVEEGRYEPNGGVWIECDCNIPGGESMIRQFLWGQHFTRKYFNYTADSFWLPDTFGYSSSIPQIMKGCGVDYFLTTKMSWNDTTNFPYDTFYWQGLDGTRVLTHLNKTHIWPDAEALTEYVATGSESIKEKTVSNKRLLSYGFGDGGGGPQFEMIEMSRRVKDLEGLPRTSHTTVSDFMKELENTVINPSVYAGELYLELHRGTLTNQHPIKRNNRLAEINLRNLEYLTVQDAVENHMTASQEEIHPLMETLLVNQFHDILPGTSIPRVHEESIKETSDLIKRSSEYILDKIKTEQKDNAISVVNTLSFERKDTLYVDYKDGYVFEGDYKQQIITDLHGNKKLAVLGAAIPAFSSAAFRLVMGTPEAQSAFEMNGQELITPYAKVIFDERGFITSFIDRAINRELRGGGYALNTFLMAEDVPNAWDNWDIDADIEFKFRDTAHLLNRRIISDGPVELRIRSEYRVSEKSTIKQDMIFYAGSPEVRFETIMNWQDNHRFLKTAFDTTIFSDFVRQEVQFGYIKRPTTRNTAEEKAKFEVSNHKYSDLSENKYGIAILNDCKYGISVKDSQMRFSLHKGGCRPDYKGDKGVHECTYSFYPHNEGFGADSVIKPAYELNYKPIVVSGEWSRPSFAGVDCGNIIIEAIKPCEEDDKAYIMRLYDAEGTYTNTTLTLNGKVKEAALTNMLEETIEKLPDTNQINLVFKPFEIKTVKITY